MTLAALLFLACIAMPRFTLMVAAALLVLPFWLFWRLVRWIGDSP